MISYKPLWKTLESKNISTYKLERDFKMSRSMIYKLKHDQSITMNSLNQLCNMFDCGINDIIEYTKD